MRRRMSSKRCRWERGSPSSGTVASRTGARPMRSTSSLGIFVGEEIAVMRDGRVAQQGTPDELYERPADLYVASKIGSPHMNTIDVNVRGDGVSLDTPFGVLPTPAVAGGLTAGESLILGIRPWDLR